MVHGANCTARQAPARAVFTVLFRWGKGADGTFRSATPAAQRPTSGLVIVPSSKCQHGTGLTLPWQSGLKGVTRSRSPFPTQNYVCKLVARAAGRVQLAASKKGLIHKQDHLAMALTSEKKGGILASIPPAGRPTPVLPKYK